MSRTDKTDPFWVRLRSMGVDEYESPHSKGYSRWTFDVPRDFKWSNAEQGAGPGEVRWAKRYRSKRNRRRDVPHTSMRGYGYGEENYKFR